MRRGVAEKRVRQWAMAAAMAAFAAAPVLAAQAGQQPAPSSSQTSGQGTQKQPAHDNGNPFPEDENSVPIMPSGNAPDFSADVNGDSRALAPAVDKDPVRSPDDGASSDASDSTEGFSSSQSGMGNLQPPPDEPRKKGSKGDDAALDAFPKETPKQDVDVGTYYLENHDWKGALSRFQSALVLAPDNPDVYWGLAECERHLGQYAAARANYLKVMEYDPGSHHARESKKALEDPEIANARPQAGKAQP